jgi:F-type H+-transporting ATPase subunit epsilon
VAEKLKLHLLTPAGPMREGMNVAGVQVPGLLGELGVLPDHEAFVTAVVPGVVRFRDPSGDVRIAVGNGFLEITRDGRAIVLCERAVSASAVDVDNVKARFHEVDAELRANLGPIDDPEYRAAAAERAWLEAQLRAAGVSVEAGH